MPTYQTTKSQALFQRAQQSLAGGVNSVARSPIAGFVPSPVYFERGEGSRMWDADGNEYIDYMLGFGPLILGHRHPEQTEAVLAVLRERGITASTCHDLEYQAAEMIVERKPSVDLVRFANSGTEAVMVALRLARGFSGKDKVVRFEGHYHGWSDVIHWNVRSPAGAIGLRHAPRPVPGTAGIAEAYADALIIQPWNDPEILEKTVKRRAHEIAAIITEPVMCNLGATMPQDGYLAFLRRLCDEHEIVLIFDEVITGFRLGRSGAQGYFGVAPDLTTMAKALGGGYPVAAVGGKRDIMKLMAQHAVSHAGTYNANTVSMAATIATLGILDRPHVYEELFTLGDCLRQGLESVLRAEGLPAVAQGAGPVLQIWFEDTPILDYRDGMLRKSPSLYAAFVKAMFKRGVIFNAAQMGVWYISTAHSRQDIDHTLDMAREAAREVKSGL